MVSTQPANRWSFGFGFNVFVDFCVWVLESDGLRVAPFDQHPDGDHALAARGLDAASWRSWLAAVLALQNDARIVQPGRKDADEFFAMASDPPASWRGGAEVGAGLAELWQQYIAVSNLRQARARFPESPEQSRVVMKLWGELKPYHARLPTLYVYFVDYPWAVEDVVPPGSVIQGIGTGTGPNSDAFRACVLRAAGRLATLPSR